MAKRQVFFSFHYSRDSWRAAQVKNMGLHIWFVFKIDCS